MITCRLQERTQARQTLWYHLQLKQLIQARHIQEVRRRMKISLITLIWLTSQQAPERNPINVQLVNSLPNLAVYLIGQLAAMPVLIHLHFPCKFLLLRFHFFHTYCSVFQLLSLAGHCFTYTWTDYLLSGPAAQ